MPTRKFVPILLLLSGVSAGVVAQTTTRTNELRLAAAEQAKKEQALSIQLQKLARDKHWPLSFKNKFGEDVVLTGVDANGYPLYTSTESNLNAANTIGTSKVWPNGGLGFSLSGASAAMKGKLGVWDGGRARPTHVELNGRINNKNATVAISDHTTHVSGTLIASGVNPQAKGMSFGAQELIVYDFNNNTSEMMTESAAGMLISNHSYGTISGWYYNTGVTPARWEFRGQAGATEDYKFGFYNDEAQMFDSIAFMSPNHLIVKSAGNNRNQIGPSVGANYWRYNSAGTMIDAGARPEGIYSNDGYDILPTSSTAKNILTVGAIEPIPSGYSQPSDAKFSDFSSWGPTDDGRIKPDVVADGVNLYSSIGTSDNAYAIYSGTSMASPSAAGSLFLLQEHWAALHPGTFMRSATLKALAIHTANEAGPAAGPDYQYGWGVLNIGNAARLISEANSSNRSDIREATLNSGQPVSFDVVASGNGELKVTLVWTDPKGTPHAASIDINTPKLVHDLDLRITRASTTYMPWVMNPASPSASATRGDNTLDNVEQIVIADVEPGATYRITISNKNTLARGAQAYSLIVSGAGGAAYCKTSMPTIANGARIDSVSFGGIQHQTDPGCNGYNNFTNFTGSVESNTTVPIYVRVNACSGGAVNKIVKAWLDLNGDGDFEDAGELLGTSPVINGDGVYSTNVTIPTGGAVGTYSVLRIIVQETSNANDVVPCGPYSKGETQDFRIRFATPANDAAITTLVAPLSPSCADGTQYVTVRFRNFSNSAKSNFVLSGSVKDGATVIQALTGTFVPSVAAGGEVEFTFQTPFVAVAGKTYTIAAKVTVAGDQDPTNDELITNVVVNATAAAPIATAEVCNNTSVLFNATNAGNDAMLWYETATATNPIAVGSPTTTAYKAGVGTYYVARNDLNGKVGPANKGALGAGSYSSGSGFFLKFTAGVPLTIENLKLYVGNAGKLIITVGKFGTWTSATGYNYTPISSTTLTLQASRTTPGQTTDDPNDQGAVYTVNLPVPEAGDYILQAQLSDGATLFRNTSVGTNPYPFSIGSVFSITGNSNGGNTNIDAYKTVYYAFYDMKIGLNGCPSARVPVVPTVIPVPVITLTANRFISSVATGNQWYVNGNEIPNATGQTYDANEAGVYKTIIRSASGCESVSNEIAYGVTGVPNIDPAEIGLKVMPNPNQGRFTLDFTVTRKSDLALTIVNAVGQKVFTSRTPGFIGRFNQVVDAGRLTPGVYLLQIQHDNKSYLKKLFIQ